MFWCVTAMLSGEWSHYDVLRSKSTDDAASTLWCHSKSLWQGRVCCCMYVLCIFKTQSNYYSRAMGWISAIDCSGVLIIIAVIIVSVITKVDLPPLNKARSWKKCLEFCETERAGALLSCIFNWNCLCCHTHWCSLFYLIIFCLFISNFIH